MVFIRKIICISLAAIMAVIGLTATSSGYETDDTFVEDVSSEETPAAETESSESVRENVSTHTVTRVVRQPSKAKLNRIEQMLAENQISSEPEPEITETVDYTRQPELPRMPLSVGEDGSDTEEFYYYKQYYDSRTGRFENISMTLEWQMYTYLKCVEYNVPFELIMGIMGVESGFNVFIGSCFDENGVEYYGPGMIHVYYSESALARKGIELKTPEGGVEAVCCAMSEKLKTFEGDVHSALIAYNMGDHGARMYMQDGNTTSGYSEWVLSIKDGLLKYREAFPDPD